MIYPIVNFSTNINTLTPRKANKASRLNFCALAPKLVEGSVLSPESLEKLEFYVEKYNFKKHKPIQYALKRTIDIAASIFGLTATTPAMLITAIAIRRESKGPIFFKQKRVGRYGKEFTIYKLRTMAHEPSTTVSTVDLAVDNLKHAKIKPPDKSKIKPIAQAVRKMGIDEFPQFVNILKGDMSLIGPRPLITNEIKMIEKNYPDSIRRFAVLPGTQLPYRTPKTQRIAQNMALEKKYLDNWNIKTEVKFFLGIIKDFFEMKNY